MVFIVLLVGIDSKIIVGEVNELSIVFRVEIGIMCLGCFFCFFLFCFMIVLICLVFRLK